MLPALLLSVCLVQGQVQTPDGRWYALDARVLKKHQRTFGGRHDYALLRSDDGQFRIAAKKALILNCDAVHLPISVPF